MDALRQIEGLIDTKAAARILGISPATLVDWRSRGTRNQPRYVRIGGRAVRYSPAELARWIEAREISPIVPCPDALYPTRTRHPK